jgi:hypothetical protein
MRIWRFLATMLVSLASLGLASGTASASPPPPTAGQIAHTVQGWTYKYIPRRAGETTDCTYNKKKLQIGYRFTCYIFNKANSQIGHVVLVTVAPRGGEWYWQYTVYRN